jgi:hypothetical protein
MSNYYFLTSIMPHLEVGHPPGMHSEELNDLLTEALSPRDWNKYTSLRRYVDLENLRAYIKGEALDPRGNYNKVALDEAVQEGLGFPEYVYDFMSRYESKEEQLRHFSFLFTQFFNEALDEEDDFLRSYFSFEREWRLVMVGARAKHAGRDVAVELQHEDPSDAITAQILAQKDAKNFEPPFGYEDLKMTFELKRGSPFELHKALSEYRFDKIMELELGSLFSINRVLEYMARLMIVEKWQELDALEGKNILEKMVSRT